MNFLLTGGPAAFSVRKTGLTFNTQVKVGSQRTQTVPVFAGAGRVDWNYATISQSDFLNVSAPSASSTAGNGTVTGSLTIRVKPMTDPGIYYGLIVITPKTPGSPR